VLLGVGRRPALGLEQRARRVVDVEAPRGEDAHVRPVRHVRRHVGPALQHQWLQAALQKVSRGGEPDGPGADDDDRQFNS
jgi:hypothetical protein